MIEVLIILGEKYLRLCAQPAEIGRKGWLSSEVFFFFFSIRPHSDRFRGEKVPTLQEAVEECIKHQLIIYFDVKGHPDEVGPSARCWLTEQHVFVTYIRIFSTHQHPVLLPYQRYNFYPLGGALNTLEERKSSQAFTNAGWFFSLWIQCQIIPREVSWWQ